MAMADQIQVAGFVALAVFALACLASGLVLVTALVYEARDHRKRQAVRQAKIAAHEARTEERHARQALYVPAHWERHTENRKAA